MRAALLPSSAAAFPSSASSDVILPFATPSAMSRTHLPDTCTASSAGVESPALDLKIRPHAAALFRKIAAVGGERAHPQKTRLR